jgi:hypothetical protein
LKFVRTSTGQRVKRCARYSSRSRTSFRSRPPANKGAHCVARKSVYSSRLRRNVLRCAKFSGGRVGVHTRPFRAPYGPRCVARKRVWSPALGKTVLRCAKLRWPERGVFAPAQNVLHVPSVAQQNQALVSSNPYANIMQSSRGRARVSSAITHVMASRRMHPEASQYLRNEQRRLQRPVFYSERFPR